MKRLRELAWVAVLFAFIVPAAHAIGDSGGCGDPLDGGLGKALRSGDAQEIEAELNKWLDNREKNLTALKRVAAPAKGTDAWRAGRSRQALNLIEGRHDKNDFCVPGALLPVAMNAGNVEGTRYLLGRPFGVDPGIPQGILFSCNYGSATEEQRVRRRQTYALVLDTERVDINARLGGRGRTALETCQDVLLLSLFMERGANLDTESASRFEVLDQAIEAALSGGDIGFTVPKGAALERAKFFSEKLTRSIRGRHIEARVRSACTPTVQGERRNLQACRALATFILATPGTFGEP